MHISLRLLVGIIVCLVALIAAIVAFLPLYFAATKSADQTAQQFSITVADSLSNQVMCLLQSVRSSVDNLNHAVKFWNINATDKESIIGLIGYGFTSVNISTSLYLDDGRYFNFAQQSVFNTSVTSPEPTLLGVATAGDTNSSTAEFSFRYLANYSLSPSYAPFTQPNTYNVTTRPFFASLRARPTWTDAYVDVSGLFEAMFVGMPLNYPAAGRSIGAFGSKLVVENNINVFLKNLSSITRGCRALLLDMRSRSFFGGNFPDPSVIVNPTTGAKRQAKLSDVTDPIAARAIQVLGLDSIYTCVTPCDLSSVGWGSLEDAPNNFFARVVALSDSYGLNMRLLVVIPTDDFLSDVHMGSRVSIGAAAGSVAGLLLLALLSLVWVLRPLKTLQKRLYESAKFLDTPDDGATSFLSEIFDMEVAYMRLHQELRKAKSFLPQNVLRQLEENSDDTESNASEGPRSLRSKAGDTVSGGVDSGAAVVAAGVALVASTTNGRTQSPPAEGASARIRNPLDSPADDVTIAANTASDSYPESPTLQQQRTTRPTSAMHNNNSATAAGQITANNQLQALGSIATGRSGEDSVRSLSHTGSTDGAGTPVVPKSKRGTSRTKRTAGPAGLNVVTTLSNRRITVVMGNVNQFHRSLALLGPEALQKGHAAIVDLLLAAVNQSRGVLDAFHGDHFTITFNASSPCAAHAIRAGRLVVSANSILKTKADSANFSMRFGCATGVALCGNLGADRMRRYSFIGPVVNHAFALMQQTRSEGVLNVINHEAYDDVLPELCAQHVNFVVLPHALEGKLISTLIEPELMERPAGQSGMTRVEITRRVNEAFVAFARGDLVTAKNLTARVPREYAGGLLKCLRSVMETLSALQ